MREQRHLIRIVGLAMGLGAALACLVLFLILIVTVVLGAVIMKGYR